MKQILSFILVLYIISLTISCENHKNKEVKVRIEAQSDPKNRKISIHTTQTTAEIFWESDSHFKLVNSKNEIFILHFADTRENTAHFKPEKHKRIPNGNYIGIYPETADIIRYDSFVFSAHSAYYIDPSNLDKYISRHMLMYTEKKHKRTSPDDLIEFKPAMTVLELPVCTDTGSFLLHTVTVIANCLCDTTSGAFIRKASFVCYGDSIKLRDREFTNVISYEFEGDKGLVVKKNPVIIKLLVWSSDIMLKCCCDSIKYTININDGYFHKSLTRHDPFSNLTYYKLPVLHIPQPQIGYNYQGGVICSTFIENGITHGFVCAPVDFPVLLAWSPSDKDFSITTYQGMSKGIFNTKNIVSEYKSGCYAAYLCNTFSLNGFYDWFLPSRDELITIHDSLYAKGFGNFEVGKHDYYWTSTQDPSHTNNAIAINFRKQAAVKSFSKKEQLYVRLIRKF